MTSVTQQFHEAQNSQYDDNVPQISSCQVQRAHVPSWV